MVKPIPIPAAVASLLEALSMPRLSLSKFFAGFDRPFDGVGQDNRDVPAPRIRPPRAGDRKASQKDKKEGKDRKEDEGPSEMVRKLEHSKVKDRLTVESGDARKKMQARRQVERANGKFPKGAMDFERLEKAERRCVRRGLAGLSATVVANNLRTDHLQLFVLLPFLLTQIPRAEPTRVHRFHDLERWDQRVPRHDLRPHLLLDLCPFLDFCTHPTVC